MWKAKVISTYEGWTLVGAASRDTGPRENIYRYLNSAKNHFRFSSFLKLSLYISNL